MTATTVPDRDGRARCVRPQPPAARRRAQRRDRDRGTQRQAPVADAAAPGGERRPDGDVPPVVPLRVRRIDPDPRHDLRRLPDPGYLATIAIFDGFGVSIFFAEDSKSGLIERFRALPMARSGGRRRSGASPTCCARPRCSRSSPWSGSSVGFGFAGSFGGIVLAYVIALGVGLRAVLGVRRHRALRARHRDRAGRVDTVLHPGVRVVVDHPRQHAARLAATDSPATSRSPRCATRCVA